MNRETVRMTEQLRSAIGNLIKEKGGDLVRETLVQAGNEEAIKAFDNIETAITDYVTKWVEERIKQTDEKIEYLARIVEDVIGRLQVERRKRLKVEADVLANVVLINGIEINPTALTAGRPENSVETMQKTHEFLDSIKLDKSSCGIVEAIRLPQRQIVINGASVLSTTIRVTFLGMAHKLALYRSLATNGKNSSKVRVQDAIPSDLMPDKRELEKVANKWRKDNPDLRTKVLCRNGEMVLLTKEKEDKKYAKVAKETIDLELQANEDLPSTSRSASPIRPASPFNTRPGRGRGGDRGRGAHSGRLTPKSSKRPRTEYDFSRFIAE